MPTQPQRRKTIDATEYDNLNKLQPDTEKYNHFVFATSLFSEIKIISAIFVRVGFQNLSSQVPLLICTFFIGHLPNAPLLIAGAGLAIAFTEVTGTAVAMGMSSALSTLVPQAIGAGQNRLIAIYFQRSFWICVVTLIPIGILQSYGGTIMCAIGQPHNICYIIENYCLLLIIYIQFFTLISILSRIGQALDFNTHLFCTSTISGLLSIPLNVLFVYKLDYGYIGTAASVAICTVLAAIMIVLVLIYHGYAFIFAPLPMHVVFTKKGIKEYLDLSLPILFQISLPFWFYDLCVLLSGYVKNPDVALSAGTIIGSLLVCMSLVSEALYLTISMRVGSYIGAGSIYYAKRSVLAAFIVYSIYAIIIGVVFIIYQDEIPYIYTNNDETANAVSDCMYIVVFRGTVYGIYINVAAVYLGLGKPKYPAYVMFFTQWILSLSVMFFLLYEMKLTDNTLYGMYVIWCTPAIGYVFGAVLLSLYSILGLDWNKALDESKVRIEGGVTDYGSTAKSPKVVVDTPGILVAGQ